MNITIATSRLDCPKSDSSSGAAPVLATGTRVVIFRRDHDGGSLNPDMCLGGRTGSGDGFLRIASPSEQVYSLREQRTVRTASR